jgi:cytosine/adenosine deaminase-related metal-dependent hydrolase
MITTKVEASIIIAYDGMTHQILSDGVVVYEDNKITHIGKSYSGSVDCTIDAKSKMVIPGFVNLHAHITQSPLSQGLKEDLPRHVTFPGSGTLSPNRWVPEPWMPEAMAKSSLYELLKSGVTTLVELGAPDWLGYKESVGLLGESGIRSYISAGYRSASWQDSVLTHDNEIGFRQLENAMSYYKQYEGSYFDRVRFILYPRTADLVSPELFKESVRLSKKYDMPMETHAAQSIGEYRTIKEHYGVNPIEHLCSLGVLTPRTILGHTIFISSHRLIDENQEAPELDFIAKTGTTVAHCPWVFARVGRTMESYAKYRDRGINIGLGTDIFPQNMVNEIRLGATLSKVVDIDSVAGTAPDLFNSATVYGANALGRGDLGRIQMGAKADLVLVSLESIRMSPVRDPIRNLVYGATDQDIDTVIVDGKTIVEDGRVLGMDEHKLANDLQRIGDHFIDSIPDRNNAGKTAEEISPISFPLWEPRTRTRIN